MEILAGVEPLAIHEETLSNNERKERPVLSVKGHQTTGLESEEAQQKRAQLENQLHISTDGHTEQEVASLRHLPSVYMRATE